MQVSRAEAMLVARRTLWCGVVVTLIGAAATLLLSVGSNMERPAARVGAVVTMGGLTIAFVAAPIAFVLTIDAVRCRVNGYISRMHGEER